MQAIALATTTLITQPDQPSWYLALDTGGRALVDQVLTTLDAKAPGLNDDQRARVFWNAMGRLGLVEQPRVVNGVAVED